MGKVLIEKLLRSCPEIARLYLLIRPSSGKDVQLRLHELINCQVSFIKQKQNTFAQNIFHKTNLFKGV